MRLGPSSSATTSTVDRALPSSAVQARCWSRPTTTTRLPLAQRLRGVLGLVPPHDHGEERRLLLPPTRHRHPEHGRAIPPSVCGSSGWSVRLPAKLTLGSVMALAPSCCLAGRAALLLRLLEVNGAFSVGAPRSAAGIEGLRVHDLRHTAGTLATAAGGSLREVMEGVCLADPATIREGYREASLWHGDGTQARKPIAGHGTGRASDPACAGGLWWSPPPESNRRPILTIDARSVHRTVQHPTYPHTTQVKGALRVECEASRGWV